KFQEEYNVEIINLAKYCTSLHEGVIMASLCRGAICIDSAFMHISVALGLPTLGIYGPFPGHLRVKYYEHADWIEPENYEECGKYPCCFHQCEIQECPFVQKRLPPGCLSSINEDKLVEKFKNLMS
ncbi:MAG: glycosyltransferase family 9 protein, partial [Candidatus Heimdallarchaeaceae archaeon]